MRRTSICYLYLALCFSLSFHLSGAIVQGSDFMPPGYCEYLSEPDRAPRELENAFNWAEKFKASSLKSVAKPAIGQFVYLPKSTRKWKFDYQPSVGHRARIDLFSYWHDSRFQLMPPTKVVRVRSQKKHTAPVLLWGVESVSDITLVTNFISTEIHGIVQSCITPIQQIPHRMTRMFDDCIRAVY